LPKTLEIQLYPNRLPAVLEAFFGHAQTSEERETLKRAMNHSQHEERTITLTVIAQLKRVGMETRLLLEGPSADARRGPDRSLKRLLAHAHRYQAMVMHHSEKTMAALAAEAGVGGPYFSRVLRLSFLAPDVVQTILKDRHPIELNARWLGANTHLPHDWKDQRKFLGFESSSRPR
jgi:hypothetical protein